MPQMPPTITYKFGDLGLVPFPFTDQTTSKKRPAVIVRLGAVHPAPPRRQPHGHYQPVRHRRRSSETVESFPGVDHGQRQAVRS
jgi:hypothetical protein